MHKILQLALILAVAMVMMPSCSLDEKEQEINKEIPASVSEILGTWGNYLNGTYYYITFSPDSIYELNVVNAFSDGNAPFLTEKGTFSMTGQKMKLKPTKGKSKYSPLEIYWDNDEHTLLNLYPLGTFSPSDYTAPSEDEDNGDNPDDNGDDGGDDGDNGDNPDDNGDDNGGDDGDNGDEPDGNPDDTGGDDGDNGDEPDGNPDDTGGDDGDNGDEPDGDAEQAV